MFVCLFENLRFIEKFSMLVNEIGDAGVSSIAAALKKNNSLTFIDFSCE